MASALKRGLLEFLAQGREDWEAAKAKSGKDPFDWKKFETRARVEKYFSLLSDAEWRAILAVLKDAGVYQIDETAVRQAINIVTCASGLFRGTGTWRLPNRNKMEAWLKQQIRLAEKLENLLPEIREYLGTEIENDAFDPHGDLHRDFRGVDDAIAAFAEHIKIIATNNWAEIDIYPISAPNAKAKPEYDRWGAGLIEVWRKGLCQPIVNGVNLQRFMVACASPYGWLASTVPETAERQARYFIGKFLEGKIETWRPSLFAEMRVKGMQKLAARSDK